MAKRSKRTLPELQMTIELRLVIGALIDLPPQTGNSIARVTGLPMGVVESGLSRMERRGWVVGEPEEKHPLDRLWRFTSEGKRFVRELAKGTPDVAPIEPIAMRRQRVEGD